MAKSELGKLQGSPWHVGYIKMKENDSRRDKRKCTYYRPEENYCSRFNEKCRGSSHCGQYYDPSSISKKKKKKKESAQMAAYWEEKRKHDSKIIIAKECRYFNLSSNSCPHYGGCIGRQFCRKYSPTAVIGVEPPTSKKKKNKNPDISQTQPPTPPIKNTFQERHPVQPGKKVITKTKNIGVVLSVNENTITVQFKNRKTEAHFPYPNCFIKGDLKIL